MPRIFLRSRLLIVGDMLMIMAASLGALALRTELNWMFYLYLKSTYWLMGISLVVMPIVFHRFGLYRRLWIYASIRDMKLLVAAVTSGSVIVSILLIALAAGKLIPSFPRSTLGIQYLLLLILIGGMRIGLRVLAESQSGVVEQGGARRVLIVGAGDAGALVVREMQKNAQLRLNPVCFVDDDPVKQRQQIHGVQVVGTLEDLPRVVLMRRIQEVIIAIPSAPGRVVRQVAEACRSRGIPFRTMPGMYELIGGKVNVSRLREVEISDLLRREPTHIEDHLVGASLTGKRVLVTGAGGSIGRELCRQIARWQPSGLLLLGHGENSIFETLLEIQADYPSLPVTPIIADIRDLDRLSVVFEQHRPQVLFHTAAHKHVPLMEANVEDAITNNVLGTRNVVETSLNFGLERLVMISTDKAIRPSSVYGATKRMAELLVLDAAHRSGLPYSVVRFGNVLGSRGSVIPIFKQQIAVGGPVTVTHPEMTRFFMTIPEAVQLVLQAAVLGRGGEVFMLDMGEPIRIVDLARDLIELSGLEVGRDIDIQFTGVRPGEKLHEELFLPHERYERTAHDKVLTVRGASDTDLSELKALMREAARAVDQDDDEMAARVLQRLVPEHALRAATRETPVRACVEAAETRVPVSGE